MRKRGTLSTLTPALSFRERETLSTLTPTLSLRERENTGLSPLPKGEG